MHATRRQFLVSAAGGAYAVRTAWDGVGAQEQKATRLILLGTKGGPRVGRGGPSNPATLLLIDGVPYVVDCGYGTSRRLLDAGVPLDRVRYIFITHHHSDHNLEYGPVIYNAWVTGLPMQVDAYGPPGLRQMTNAFFEYQKFDIDTRISDEGRPDLRTLVTAHEYSGAGVVLQNETVKVTAAQVRHPPITHAYALRFDTKDRSIVISGDTAYSPELVALARGADILVHEIMSLAGIDFLLKHVPNAARLREHLLASHTLPEEVGKAAAQAGVKTLVLTHFVPPDAPLAERDWVDGVRKHFSGRVVFGRDLMEI